MRKVWAICERVWGLIHFCLFPTVEAPRTAGRKLAPLADWVDQRSLSDIRTVITQLVTVSVAYGASGPIDIQIDFRDGEVEAVLEDAGPGPRAMASAKERRDRSLVLQTIQSLVDEWGTDHLRSRVWFRMSVSRHLDPDAPLCPWVAQLAAAPN